MSGMVFECPTTSTVCPRVFADGAGDVLWMRGAAGPDDLWREVRGARRRLRRRAGTRELRRDHRGDTGVLDRKPQIARARLACRRERRIVRRLARLSRRVEPGSRSSSAPRDSGDRRQKRERQTDAANPL